MRPPRRTREQLRADLERRRSNAATPQQHRSTNRNRTRSQRKARAIAEQTR